MENFEETAKQSAKIRRERIKLIPDDCKINPEYLDSMSNDEFIELFRQMQNLIIKIYEDVETAPFDWGYPKENNTKSISGTAYNRISDFFQGLIENGEVLDEKLIVNSKTIPKSYDNKASFRIAVRTHKNIEMIINKLSNFGFCFTGYDKKAESFSVSYPNNHLLLKILQTYAKAQDDTITYSGVKFSSFSYRWVEDHSEQKHEPIFLVKMDISPIEIQEIQYWLYDKAKEYGYSIDRKKPFDKDCIHYTKGSKEFILVGEKHFGEEYLGNSVRMFSKVIFRNVFSSHPDKVSLLSEKFPGVFGKSYATCHRCNGRKGADEQCSMRICYNLNGTYYENCAYQSFNFFNPVLETFKDIFELFIIENNIR